MLTARITALGHVENLKKNLTISASLRANMSKSWKTYDFFNIFLGKYVENVKKSYDDVKVDYAKKRPDLRG